MTAALALADKGFPVDLVERATRLGGIARHLFKNWKGENVAFYLEMLASRVMEHNLITVHHKSTVIAAEGHIGSFRSTIHKQTGNISVDHGVTICWPPAVNLIKPPNTAREIQEGKSSLNFHSRIRRFYKVDRRWPVW